MSSHAGPVIFLMGPTATGKTNVAAGLFDRFAVELVSVDAAQVYRGMNIGTAKPDAEFLHRYPHHLIDIREPVDTFNAASFVSEARRLMHEIRSRGNTPLFVGGTMFYFYALEHGLSALPASDPGSRRRIAAEMSAKGVVAMHEQLSRIDARIAQRIGAHDSQRIQRALEIYNTAGVPPSELMAEACGLSQPPLKLALFDSDRNNLHRRIADRFELMLEMGLVEEVERLLTRIPGFASCPAGRIVGYRQTIDFLEGQYNRQSLVDKGVAATRQLAKRQLTWLRQQSGVVWFDTAAHQVDKVVCVYLRSGVFSSCSRIYSQPE